MHISSTLCSLALALALGSSLVAIPDEAAYTTTAAMRPTGLTI